MQAISSLPILGERALLVATLSLMSREIPSSAEAEALRSRGVHESSDLEGAEIAIKDLPALPQPHRCEQLSESMLGITVVSLLIALFVGLTQGVAVGAPPYGAEWLALVCIYLEAAVAIGALCGLLCGDPGVVRRSPETCYPVPPEVLARLQRGESLIGLSNITDQQLGRTYCVRCLVWRPDGGSMGSRFPGSSMCHHCATCQRCVTDFDHHCGVFGRCIAGSGWRGNMKYFKCIISMAGCAMLTCIAPLIVRIIREPTTPHSSSRTVG